MSEERWNGGSFGRPLRLAFAVAFVSGMARIVPADAPATMPPPSEAPAASAATPAPPAGPATSSDAPAASDAPTAKVEGANHRAVERLKLAERLMNVQPPRLARSPHYMMMTDVKEPGVPQAVLSLVEECRTGFVEYFTGKIDLSVTGERGWIIMFSSKGSFRSFGAGESTTSMPEPLVGGIALSGESSSTTTMLMDSMSYAVFAHLTENLLLQQREAGPSVWVVQGLGNYFGLTPRAKDGKPEYGKIVVAPNKRQYAYRSALIVFLGKVKIENLLEDKGEADVRNSQFLFQASCWAFVHYLLHGDGERGPRLLMDYIRSGRAGKHGVEAFKQALGSDSFAELDKSWRRYVQAMPK